MHPQDDKRSSLKGQKHDSLLIMNNNDTPEKPRAPYLTASDYVFYIRRQLARERGFEGDPPEDKNMMVELPKLTDLLRRLREDLGNSFTSFVEDFVCEPNDGVIWLLDLLKACQNRKTRSDGKMSLRNKERHQNVKRALADEFECLLCLRFSTRTTKTVEKIVNHRSGMSTVATCIMSDFTKSRMVALQLLTRVCQKSPVGFQKVLEAMSSLRLIYGESVRFKFLAAILNGNANTPPGFECVALSFLNMVLSRCPRASERIRLQCELEEAGFQISLLETKLRGKELAKEDQTWNEVEFWKDRYLDVDALLDDRKKYMVENARLQTELDALRKSTKKSEHDKYNTTKKERDLKDRGKGLENELGPPVDSKPRIIGASPKGFPKKVIPSEDSDSSDQLATDSGRCSFITDDSSPAEENDQPGSEEIFIDIPTICPPAGFRSLNILDDSLDMKRFQMSLLQETSSKSTVQANRTLEREKEKLQWEYPIVPKISSTIAVLKRSRSEDKSRSNKKSLRTRSEERKPQPTEDVKFTEATGFFFKSRNRKPLKQLFPDSFKTSPTHNRSFKHEWNTNSLPANHHHSSSKQQLATQQSNESKHFPLPPAYKTNFILRGHSNCDMYSTGLDSPQISKSPFQKNQPSRDSMRKLQPLESTDSSDSKQTFVKNGGGRKSEANKTHSRKNSESATLSVARNSSGLDVSPNGTISALVHKEITEAVRQISGWL